MCRTNVAFKDTKNNKEKGAAAASHSVCTPCLQRRETAEDHYYCLLDKRGHETAEWRNDEEVESHIQHML